MNEPLFPPPPAPTLRMPRSPRSRLGPWLSLIAHLLIILFVVEYARLGNIWEAEVPAGSADPASGGGGAGRQVTMIALSAPAAAAVVKAPPVHVPPPPPPPTITPTPAPPPVTAPAADTVPHAAEVTGTAGSGGGSGGGTGPGTGPGSGPGSGQGKGTAGVPTSTDSVVPTGRPPEPRQVILPPFDYPRSIHGQTFTVTFFVRETGRVDRVVFDPEVPDRGFARKFGETMKGYAFRPARSAAGLPVPGVYTINFTF